MDSSFNSRENLQGHHAEIKRIGMGWEGREMVATVGPDFADIDANLGWTEPDEPAGPNPHDKAMEAASDILAPLLGWLASGDCISSIGRRTIMLVQAIRPELLDGATLWQLAKRFKCTRQSFSKYNAELHTLTRGLYNRRNGFRSENVRVAARNAQRKQHELRGHNRTKPGHLGTHRARVRAQKILATIDTQKACKPPREE